MDIFIFAGEKSGDLLGEGLVRNLSHHRFFGVPGPRMRAAGVEEWLPMETFQVMGLKDILFALPRLQKVFYSLKKRILARDPPVAIFIDYPGFNLRMERSLRASGFRGKLVHYVCPSVWIHGAARADAMDTHLDLLLSILPFESEFFKEKNLSLPVHFVGHPLVKVCSEYPRSKKRDKELLAIFPGSRLGEIRDNFPRQVQAADRLGLNVHVSAASQEVEKVLRGYMGDRPWTIVPQNARHDLMAKAGLAFATSGTITLELALMGTPTIVTYHLNWVNYLMAKFVIKLDRKRFFSLPNIIAGKEIFPELMHRQFTVPRLVELSKYLLEKGEIEDICSLMDTKDANKKAALAVEKLLCATS